MKEIVREVMEEIEKDEIYCAEDISFSDEKSSCPHCGTKYEDEYSMALCTCFEEFVE